MMNLPLNIPPFGELPHIIDLRLQVGLCLAILGTLPSVIPSLSTCETGIVTPTVFLVWLGDHRLDLTFILDVPLLPGWLELKLGLLPSTNLLKNLPFLLGFKLAFAVFIGSLMIINQFVFPFSNECLVHQSLEVGEIQHTECTPEGMIEPSKEPIYLSFFGGYIMSGIMGQMIELV